MYNFFVVKPPQIIGEPDYKNVKEMYDVHKANVTKLPSILGGRNNGHIGMIVTAAVYNTSILVHNPSSQVEQRQHKSNIQQE